MALESTMLPLGTPAPDFDLIDTVSGDQVKLADLSDAKVRRFGGGCGGVDFP